MFGLLQSSQLEATQSNNARRMVFFQYPQGAFPLMGLLSMMEDDEETDKNTFQWYEYRHKFSYSQTVANSGNGPFTDTSGAAGAAGVPLTSGGWTQAAQTYVRVCVQDASQFRQRDVVWIKDQPISGGTAGQIRGVVDAVYTGPNTIDVRLLDVCTNFLNSNSAYVSGGLTGGNVGATVAQIGIATVEGGYSKIGGVQFPVEPSNYTQTFRTVIGPFSRDALKMGQNFDREGIYRQAAKQAHLRHMESLERAAFWGIRKTNTVTDADDNVQKTEKMFGGILWFLQQYELGTVSNGAIVDYRPNGTDLTNVAWNADPAKRVIKPGGAVTKAQFESLIERMFFYTGDGTFEKLVVCGNSFLTTFNQFAERNSIKVVQLREKEETYGMQVTMWETIYGTLYFKSHPQFTYHPLFSNSAFVVDMSSIKYRPYQDSDTMLLTNRQARDFDGRKDEWLTEYGLEMKFPERFMYIEGMTAIYN